MNTANTFIEIDRAWNLIWEQLAQAPLNAFRTQLAPTSRQPIELPDGWRFPFDLFFDGIRVRKGMVILFVDRQGILTVEQGDSAEISGLLTRLRPPAPPPNDPQQSLPPPSAGKPPPSRLTVSQAELAQQIDMLRQQPEYSDMQVESIEQVWSADTPDADLTPQWRVGLRAGSLRSRVMLGPERDLRSLRPEPSDSRRSLSWQIGPARYAEQRLSVDLSGLAETMQTRQRNLWAIWSCMAYISQFTANLGFSQLSAYNVALEFDMPANREGANFDVINGVPTISFPREGAWADDPSIVLHELGHAFWNLLFTRPPQGMDVHTWPEGLVGIEEGFADYFAAMHLASDPLALVLIGGALEANFAAQYGLPRRLDRATAVMFQRANRDPHHLGAVWANLLWALRASQLEAGGTARELDRRILLAHLRPTGAPQQPTDPLSAYFRSLAAAFPSLDPAAWKALLAPYGLVELVQVLPPQQRRPTGGETAA